MKTIQTFKDVPPGALLYDYDGVPVATVGVYGWAFDTKPARRIATAPLAVNAVRVDRSKFITLLREVAKESKAAAPVAA